MNEKIARIVADAINDVNKSLPENEKIKQCMDSFLMGPDGPLDSLGLINLIVAVEQRIQKEFKRSIVLANENAMSQKSSPFLTIGTLVGYVSDLIGS